MKRKGKLTVIFDTMNIGHKWRRLMAVGCSHGVLINRTAKENVLRFRANWKPDLMAHLGDFCDTTAFRAGAKGTKDETEPVAPDIDAGVDFLEELGCNLVCLGNHEGRIWNLCDHYNAIIAGFAASIRMKMVDRIRNQMKATLIERWGIDGWHRVGDYKFGHGYIFTENCARDHAEAHGNVVFAHAHRAAVQKGRRDDHPTGICVGTLIDAKQAGYAQNRKSTLSWSAGFVWGEYTDKHCVLWLHEQPANVKEWRLPIV